MAAGAICESLSNPQKWVNQAFYRGCNPPIPKWANRNPPGFLLLLYPPRSECPVNGKAVGIAPTHSRFSSPGIHARCQQHSRHTGRHRGCQAIPKASPGWSPPPQKKHSHLHYTTRMEFGYFSDLYILFLQGNITQILEEVLP